MKALVILGQYHVQYEGQLMPNVLGVWDEFILEDNYAGYEEELAKFNEWVKKGDLAAVAVIEIELPDKAVLDAFQPTPVPVRIIDGPSA